MPAKGPVMTDVDIQISSRGDTKKHLKAGHRFKAVVSLCDVDGPDQRPPWIVRQNLVPTLVLRLDDVERPDPEVRERFGYQAPTKEDVERIVRFAETHGNVPYLVHCSAGVSRSSASALIIAHHLTGMEPSALCLKILDDDWHWPNALLLLYYDQIANAGLETAAAMWRSRVTGEKNG